MNEDIKGIIIELHNKLLKEKTKERDMKVLEAETYLKGYTKALWDYSNAVEKELCELLQKYDEGNEHVYCTDCKNLHFVKDSHGEMTPACAYENVCDILNCEDSVPLRERPFYEEINKI